MVRLAIVLQQLSVEMSCKILLIFNVLTVFISVIRRSEILLCTTSKEERVVTSRS